MCRELTYPLSVYKMSYLRTIFMSCLCRELTLCVNVDEFEAFMRMMLARRQALGKGTKINFLQSAVQEVETE